MRKKLLFLLLVIGIVPSAVLLRGRVLSFSENDVKGEMVRLWVPKYGQPASFRYSGARLSVSHFLIISYSVGFTTRTFRGSDIAEGWVSWYLIPFRKVEMFGPAVDP
jgi:hypothetical protein